MSIIQQAKRRVSLYIPVIKGLLAGQQFDQFHHDDEGPYRALTTSLTALEGSSNIEARTQQFKDAIFTSHIDIQELSRIASYGVPDVDIQGQNLRAIVWKLLLNYLPPEPAEWKAALDKTRRRYEDFCKDLMISSGKVVAASQGGSQQKPGAAAPPTSEPNESVVSLAGHSVQEDAHPLTLDEQSKWREFFEDTEVLEQIERDVLRTHPDMHFFTGDDIKAVSHREDMMRALFIFAKLNSGVRYVQGMNEVYAPLYFVFKTDRDSSWSQHAEGDAFFCYVELLSEFRDNFCKQLDHSALGVKASLDKFSDMLQLNDPELWHHVWQRNKLDPQFYAFRWITLILTQEFTLPDLLRLWDTIISIRHGRLNFLLKVCCSMLITVRDELLAGDFSNNLKLLQNYPPVDVQQLLNLAITLRPRD